MKEVGTSSSTVLDPWHACHSCEQLQRWQEVVGVKKQLPRGTEPLPSNTNISISMPAGLPSTQVLETLHEPSYVVPAPGLLLK